MTRITLCEGDNRDHLRRLIDEGVRVHSVVTDPPYGISFMGKAWDGTQIERDPEFWKLILEILLPGGYCFAFSGSRTGHWQACAMEMAGFVMHPMHGWCFGSGFPKAHNAGQAVEKFLTTGKARRPDRDLGGLPRNRWSGSEEGTLFADTGGHVELTTSEAAHWEGWAYGTQAQKPALEPIYLGQKPFSEKTGAANLLKHGVGAVNIDGCRVPTDETITNHSRGAESAISKGKYGDSKAQETHQTAGQLLGRHPANLILDGSPEVVEMFPDSKAGVQRKPLGTGGIWSGKSNDPCGPQYGDSGSAARFFHQFSPDTDPLIYHGKANKQDRVGSKHPTVKPVALMAYLVRHITPPGGVVLDPFAGSGTTGEAARREGFDCILMEQEPEHIEFLKRRFSLNDEDDLEALLA